MFRAPLLQADVLRQLPPKREQIVAVELSAMQKQVGKRECGCLCGTAGNGKEAASRLWPCTPLTTHFLHAAQRYRWILEASYESLTKGSVGKLKNVMMELRKTVRNHRPAAPATARETTPPPLSLQTRESSCPLPLLLVERPACLPSLPPPALCSQPAPPPAPLPATPGLPTHHRLHMYPSVRPLIHSLPHRRCNTSICANSPSSRGPQAPPGCSCCSTGRASCRCWTACCRRAVLVPVVKGRPPQPLHWQLCLGAAAARRVEQAVASLLHGAAMSLPLLALPALPTDCAALHNQPSLI